MGVNLPTVSIVIPTYNLAHWLPDAMRSVQDQTYTKWECLVVDDGSTDDTSRVVEGFLKEDGRFKYICTENGGPSQARNVGIGSTDGELLAFLDADDIWLPEKLQHQVDLLSAKPLVGLCCCYFEIVNQNLDNVMTWPEIAGSSRFPEEIGSEDFLRCFPNNIVTGSASAAVVRRECLQQAGVFDSNLVLGEDWDLWYRISLNAAIAQEERVLVKLRRYPKQQDIEVFLWNRNYLLKKVGRIMPAAHSKIYQNYMKPRAFTEAFDLCLEHWQMLTALGYLAKQTTRQPVMTAGYLKDKLVSFLRNRL